MTATEPAGQPDPSQLSDREATWRTAMIESLQDGFYVVDDEGAIVEVNEAFGVVLGYGAEGLPYRPPFPWWPDPDSDPQEHRRLTEVISGGRSGRHVVRLVHRDGHRIWVALSYSALTDPETGRQSRVGTLRDVTAEHEAVEQLRGRADADRSARGAAEAVTAQLRALVDGLAAVVWDIDARSREVRFVSERVEKLLGYQVQRWLGPADIWREVIHPDDQDRVLAHAEQALATATNYEVACRARTADGRIVWLQNLVHLVTGECGDVERLQVVTIDVTEHERTRQASALLAEVGRQQAELGPLDERLNALLTAAVPVLADLGVVSVLGPDGELAPVVASRPGRPDVEEFVLAADGHPVPAVLLPLYEAGRPFVVQTPTDHGLRAFSARVEDYQTRRALGVRSTLIVPLVIGGRLLGALSMISTERSREHDAADLALAGELGRRTALMIEGERLATREHTLGQITASLSAAGTVAGAARALVAGVLDAFEATAVAVYVAHPAHGLRIVHSTGYPEIILSRFGTARTSDDQPAAECARTAQAVWLREDDDWQQRYPHLLGYHTAVGATALMAVPMMIGDTVLGVLVGGFGTRRRFDPDEQQFARTLAAQAAQAFERAALADTRREIAETLQRSLLPTDLPQLERLALAARYEPGVHGTQAGGDWYEVLPLDDDRVAIVVGDVVGQGAPAAAVMGQLRSALAATLLDGIGPAAALTRLDRFARYVAGARASTVACSVLDLRTGELCWARAGHPPPLVVTADGARYLEGATGAVLGAPGGCGFTEERVRLAPGSALVLYTDGLVERRGEVIDDGLARLAVAAVAAGQVPPEELITELLARTLHPAGAPDDVALIVARLVPAPLRLRLPARPDQLRMLRRATGEWVRTAGVSPDTADDLQLAVGEAAANAVEHAYRGAGSPGEITGDFEVELRTEAAGAVSAQIRDFGVWRPAPADKGFRGRGVDLIRELGTDVAIVPSDRGTTVRFRVRPRGTTRPESGPSRAAAEPAARSTEPMAGATRPVDGATDPVVGRASTAPGSVSMVTRAALRVVHEGTGRCIALTGELDLAGVQELRDALLAELADRSGATTIDLTGLAYLASAGVGLLAEALAHPFEGSPVRLRIPDSGPVRAVLDLVRLDEWRSQRR